MRSNLLLALSAATALSAAGPAFAANSAAQMGTAKAGQYSNVMTTARLQDLYDDRSLVGDNQYTGVGSIFVSYESTAVDGFGSLCTASLVSKNVLLTAAHCVVDEGASNKVTGVQLILPSFGNAIDGDPSTPFEVYDITANNIQVSPYYNGNSYHGGDFALLKLDELIEGHETYDIYTGSDEISTNQSQVYTRIGTGTTGTGDLGEVDSLSDYYKRYGYNEYEYTWDQVFDALGDTYGAPPGYYNDYFDVIAGNLLASDADSGLAVNDVFGRYMGKKNVGVFVDGEPRDTMTSFGDSGGPTFIDGKIAGVASFLITGNIFEPGDCATRGSVDPSKDFATGVGCNNASFGELSADTRVSFYQDYIQAFIDAAAPVPEPSSWAMMMAGFAAVGAMLRRRRRIERPVQAI